MIKVYHAKSRDLQKVIILIPVSTADAPKPVPIFFSPIANSNIFLIGFIM